MKTIIGRTIVNVRPLNEAEKKSLYWFEDGIVIVLDDGTTLLPTRDEEGNSPGALYYSTGDGCFVVR